MAARSPLCRDCDKVVLDPERLASEAKDRKWTIGRGSVIRTSPCPLCRAVRRVFHEDQRTETTSSPNSLGSTDDNRIALKWKSNWGPGRRGAFFVGDGSLDAHQLCFFKRHESAQHMSGVEYLRHNLEGETKTSRIARWIVKCKADHEGECNVKRPEKNFGHAYPGLAKIRFIDVLENRLVELKEPVSYVTLSYVWGSVSTFRLTRANLRRLTELNSLVDVWRMVPRTIQDAIQLVRQLDIRYLWVDALCLLQNDLDDVGRGVKVMDRIYEQSELTIVAANGHDANSGLLGVGEGSVPRSVEPMEVKPGVFLGVYTSLDRLLKSSVYATRAWTFQEELLSRRVVYFIDNKIFFRCRRAEYAESCYDTKHPTPPEMNGASLLPTSLRMLDPIIDFGTLLVYYTGRVLSDQKDAEAAMAGIVRRVSEKGHTEFFQGLPMSVLDVFLLFKSCGNSVMKRRREFPSYSWLGWQGQVKVDDPLPDINTWLEMRTWIVWYRLTRAGLRKLVREPAEIPPEYVGYRRRRSFPRDKLDGAVTPRPRSFPSRPTQNLEFPANVEYPILQFWTLSIRLKLDRVDVFRGSADLVNVREQAVGRISLDGFEEFDFFESREPFELIVLSSGLVHVPVDIPGRTFIEGFNVMLLEWSEGVAERRGIGTVGTSALATSFDPGPTWKEILLK